MTRWTDTDDQILRKWHAQGLTDNALADKMGRSFAATSKRRQILKLPVNLARAAKKFTAAELSEVRQQCKNDVSIPAIARKFHYPLETVRLAVTDIIQARKAERGTLNDRIIKLRTSGNLTCGEIAAKLHLSRNSVIGVLHRAGVAAPGFYQRKPIGKRNKAIPNAPTVTRDPYKGEWPKGCQYPNGEGAGLKWCDEPKQAGKPYCTQHERVCHVQRGEMLEAAE